jgi:hypothetical protein
LKFRSPVLVPAVVRVSATPVVSEYGSVVGTSELVVVPAYAGPANDPVLLNRFAPLNCNAVLDVWQTGFTGSQSQLLAIGGTNSGDNGTVTGRAWGGTLRNFSRRADS